MDDKTYLYIKSDNSDVIIRIIKVDMIMSLIRGDEDLFDYILDDFDIEPYTDMDDVVDMFKEEFDVVEEIEELDIDDFIKNKGNK